MIQGGLVDNRLMSAKQMKDYSKLPDIGTLQGQLAGILSQSVGSTYNLLQRNQEALVANLGQWMKQREGTSVWPRNIQLVGYRHFISMLRSFSEECNGIPCEGEQIILIKLQVVNHHGAPVLRTNATQNRLHMVLSQTYPSWTSWEKMWKSLDPSVSFNSLFYLYLCNDYTLPWWKLWNKANI